MYDCMCRVNKNFHNSLIASTVPYLVTLCVGVLGICKRVFVCFFYSGIIIKVMIVFVVMQIYDGDVVTHHS